MTQHQPPEPPAKYSYAVGAGLGLLVGGGIALIVDNDNFLPGAALGIVGGIVVAFLVQSFRR